MHAEILPAVFPPQHPHGQIMHHNGSYNQQIDQLKPPLHAIGKELSSYQPTFVIGHFDGIQSKGTVSVQYSENQVAATNVIAAVHQPSMHYEDFAHDSPNDLHRLPNPSSPQTHTEGGQPPFSVGHTGASRLQTAVPNLVPENEIIVLEHGGAGPYENAGGYSSNRHHSGSDCEEIPVDTTTASLDLYRHLDRSRSHSPIPVVFPENEIIVLEHGGTESYEHVGNYPFGHHRQRSDCEKILVETTTISFDRYLDRSRSHSPMPIVVPENEIIVLEHGGTESYEHAGNYPSDHHRQRSDCEKIPVETTTISFDQHQYLHRSRSHSPMPIVVPENEIIVLEHGGIESYEHAGNYSSDHHRQRSDCEKIPVETTTISFDQRQYLHRSRSHSPMPVVIPENEIIVLEHSGSYEHAGNYLSDDHRQRSDCEKIPVEMATISFDQRQYLDRSRSHSPMSVVVPENEIIVLQHSGTEPYTHRHRSECEKIAVETTTINFDQYQKSRSHTPISVVPGEAYPERCDALPPRQEEPQTYVQDGDFASRAHQDLIPANPPTHQPHVGANHCSMPIRPKTPPQTSAVIISEPVFPPPTPGFRVIPEPQPQFYLLQHEPMTDEQAATSVYNHFSQRNNNPQQMNAEQELSRLILSSPFMTGCLGEVVHWANILLFEGKLTVAKVDLQWSDPADPRFDPNSGGLIGTTELKPDHTGGFQTRIILSRQRLMSGTYDQRLVLSAILHECVHAYLFISRGPEATEEGGHTKGFRDIARLIDSWVDGDGSYLRLHCDEADLESFKTSAGHGWNCQRAAWGLDNGFLWTSSRL